MLIHAEEKEETEFLGMKRRHNDIIFRLSSPPPSPTIKPSTQPNTSRMKSTGPKRTYLGDNIVVQLEGDPPSGGLVDGDVKVNGTVMGRIGLGKREELGIESG